MKDPNAGITQKQLDAYWMPFTGNRQFKSDPRIITAADGCYYTDADGRQIPSYEAMATFCYASMFAKFMQTLLWERL